MATLSLPDAELAYTVTGEGPAMLFLAGTAWPGTAWTLNQVPEFSRDHRTIIYDQRGTGASIAHSTDFSTERLAADAVALLDHLGVERAIVVGHSNGGRVAQLIAIRYAERVDKLVLLSAGATHGGDRGVPIPIIVKLVELGYREWVRAAEIELGCTKAFYAAHRVQVDAFVDLVLGELTPLETMLQHVVGRHTSDTTSHLGEIRAPTLVVVGDDETNGGGVGTTHFEFAKILATRIPNARSVVLDDEGHLYPFLSPEKTNAAIRAFLRGAA